MAEKFVLEQFARRQCRTNANEKEHLREFGDFWGGLHLEWLAILTAAERTIFEDLVPDCERDAFRIVRSYARKAAVDNRPDFRVVRDDLAARVGMTGRGAGLLIRRFSSAGILDRTQEYVPHKSAARYRYLLPMEERP